MGASASSQAPTVAPSASNAAQVAPKPFGASNASNAAPKAPNAVATSNAAAAPFATGGPAEVLTGGFFWPVSPKKSATKKAASSSSSSSTKSKATKKAAKPKSKKSDGKLPASLDDRTVEQLKARAKALGVPCISSLNKKQLIAAIRKRSGRK